MLTHGSEQQQVYAACDLSGPNPGLNPEPSSCPPASAAAEDDGGLKVQEIDAYWLQRRISQTLTHLDAAAAQQLAQEVLEALQVCGVSLCRLYALVGSPLRLGGVAFMLGLGCLYACVGLGGVVWVRVWSCGVRDTSVLG